jgi:hypothetical protein
MKNERGIIPLLLMGLNWVTGALLMVAVLATQSMSMSMALANEDMF